MKVPMFDDCERMSVAVMDIGAWGSASWKVLPPSSIWSGTPNVVVGLICPASRAAENATSLNTLPGS